LLGAFGPMFFAADSDASSVSSCRIKNRFPDLDQIVLAYVQELAGTAAFVLEHT
jgi:hypothetical protein